MATSSSRLWYGIGLLFQGGLRSARSHPQAHEADLHGVDVPKRVRDPVQPVSNTSEVLDPGLRKVPA